MVYHKIVQHSHSATVNNETLRSTISNNEIFNSIKLKCATINSGTLKSAT